MGDPVIAYAALAVLAALFWLGALHKLRNFAGFEAAVAGYRLMPAVLQRPFALAFIAAEVLAGGLLLLPAARTAGILTALAVLAAASLGVAVNLLRGRTDIDCGCGGLSQAPTSLSWWVVLRNGLLAVLALLAWPQAGGPSPRDLVWLDGITFFGMSLALIGLYLAFNQLLASHLEMRKRSQS
ncbi:Methylamine utilization protein MauE [Castellaniella defragrans 65Phen]|uniref:Methylamine utilization protein MauE n=1 Tax=Castellaniella defragrans (strain DSM 12143 / CCUG 39792 / 65Phen) TaxID=1437824 RepID=W8X1G4_CASD6|nr:MauE/DoxX family redox-associated membrane protein [Castellaniella defragrans]CDM25933.1 Methylamine utilization protein MauE [Castellaniella defragrans 65Phen]